MTNTYLRGLLPSVLLGYTKLKAYPQALAVAQTETDPPERERLTQLVQCAAAQ